MAVIVNMVCCQYSQAKIKDLSEKNCFHAISKDLKNFESLILFYVFFLDGKLILSIPSCSALSLKQNFPWTVELGTSVYFYIGI